MLIKQDTGFDQVEINLLDEERIALSLPIDHAHQSLRRRLAG